MVTRPPLFILSGPRSGSTLLRYILDTHAAIASPGEIEIGTACEYLLGVIRGTRGEASRSLTPERRDEVAIAETRLVIDGIMSAYLELKGKTIWCEKSVSNLQKLPVLSAVFPDALYVCLYRDSLDVVHSCLECSRLGFMKEVSDYVARQPRNLLAAMMSAWTDNNTSLLDFERQHADRCFRIRYEDLVTAPEDSLRPLLSFAGVDWESDLLARVFSTQHDQGGGDLKILFSQAIDTASVGCGSRINLALIPDEVKRAAERPSTELSYPPLAAGRRLPWLAAAEQGTEAAAVRAGVGLIAAGLGEKCHEWAELARTIHGSCMLVLQGQGGGSWKLDFAGSPPTVTTDAGPADCSLSMSVADFVEMLAGGSHPAAALWDSKVIAGGDFTMARQVGQLLYLVTRGKAS